MPRHCFECGNRIHGRTQVRGLHNWCRRGESTPQHVQAHTRVAAADPLTPAEEHAWARLTRRKLKHTDGDTVHVPTLSIIYFTICTGQHCSYCAPRRYVTMNLTILMYMLVYGHAYGKRHFLLHDSHLKCICYALMYHNSHVNTARYMLRMRMRLCVRVCKNACKCM